MINFSEKINLLKKPILAITMSTLTLGWSGVALADWFVYDSRVETGVSKVETEARDINTKLQLLNDRFKETFKIGPNTFSGSAPAALPTRYADTLTDTLITSGTSYTYGAGKAAVAYPATLSTPCTNGANGASKTPTPIGLQILASCEAARNVVAAGYYHSIEYYKKFEEYNAALRALAATDITAGVTNTDGGMGRLAALQFKVTSISAVQQSESALFAANMEMHRSALAVLAERHKQLEKEQVKGASNRTGNNILKTAMLLLGAF